MSSNPSEESVADSNVIAMPAKTDSTNDTAIKVIMVCAALAAIFGGGAWALDARTDNAIEKHAERPHVGVATKEDIKQLRSDLSKQDEKTDAKLDKIMAAVVKK